MKQQDQMSLKVHKKIICNLTLPMISVLFDGILENLLRRIVFEIIDRSKKVDKQLFQFYILRNEAYYFAAKNTLEVKTKERYSV